MIVIAFDNNKRTVAISQSLLKSKNMQASLIEIFFFENEQALLR